MSSLTETARWIACARAAESLRPDRLFDDSLAVEYLRRTDPELYAGLRSEPSSRFDVLAVRTRFFDDCLLRAVTEGAPRQVVVLAAGLDGRAFRLPWPADVTLYEVDLPEAIEEKSAFLARHGPATARCRRVPVSGDLTGDWPAALAEAGFRGDLPTAWLAEGVLYYLTGDQVDAVVDQVTELSAPGSVLCLEQVNTDLYRAPWMQQWLRTMRDEGRPWLSGVADPETWLARRGWRAAVHEPCHLPEAEGRLVPRTPPRDVPGAARTWLIRADLVNESNDPGRPGQPHDPAG
ncbi:SAM-dependent methyltransferase [Streptomyces chitinivorans]|uniref:S-adenosyl-L-methionine-dependent methyltransferase n=1 Tax=Streptomyces chitinivorans TaxID=1257027 RepID=A0ABW7HS45_9ACTN|nr:SAM-dependent methyltransferase [Streptomyces chitinivorans]MDH2411694.1 SAM-dependent methyltransferase [Streptomyces chitinivorans]